MGYDLSYDTLAEVVAAAEAADARLSDVVLAHEAEALEMGTDELFFEMAGRLRVMDECIDPGCAEGLRSPSGLTGGDAHREREAVRSGRSLVGGVVGGALYRALAVSELNAAMGRIVAAPTAGSCGILPAAVLTMRDELGASERDCVMSLFAAAGVGLVIERNASLAGAEGGCQAECGSAAAMAAAAVVELAGGTPAQAAGAVSIAIQSMLGLVCDPVAGLVEVPCVKRNASGVAMALVAAELALAGCGATIPADEAIGAMRRVGRAMPESLRETAEGGLATTPTALRLAEEIFGPGAGGSGAGAAGATGACPGVSGPGAAACAACGALR
ncbi:L-serine ammonia-lyase, iron-sulfur-dependent, subunit alpha [uncultured Parolsenella sp.]|mgnify:FL=1|uniref:L-serine ammonia-lyase, iron-sulfur-dependent, subunit alpha n=1 Tax=uncultured Parolsenella sp. TaxID=2083008 RepID=UPI0027DC4865|nr:L-serine ammonia-lyase, iron-sulfur-dependent, subunit alpha [uncultured Parolsenella sp.]